MTSLNDPLGKIFIEFFETQGVKFVDADTGERITTRDGELIRVKEDKNENR